MAEVGSKAPLQRVETDASATISRRVSLSSLSSAVRLLRGGGDEDINLKISDYLQPDPKFLSTATDDTIIEVPIYTGHWPVRRRYALVRRFNDNMTPGVGPNEEFKILRMKKSEWEMYWKRNEQGEYMGTEKEGEGLRRLQAQGW